MENDDDDDGLDGDESKTCERCRFFRDVMDGTGECRRFSPQPGRMKFGPRRNLDDDYRAEWPTVAAMDWCGEFEEHPHKVSKSWE